LISKNFEIRAKNKNNGETTTEKEAEAA